MTGIYETLVYDLDGTLVRLDVDWDAVRTQIADALRERDIDISNAGVWELLDRAEAAGHRGVVEDILARHEREGAQSADRLLLAEELPASVPVGVCSLNCEAACRIALERHDLDGHVDAIVGRDTVETRKPDPGPLLEAIERIDGEPATTVFIGDSDSDRVTAERAGVDFESVSDRTGANRSK